MSIDFTTAKPSVAAFIKAIRGIIPSEFVIEEAPVDNKEAHLKLVCLVPRNVLQEHTNIDTMIAECFLDQLNPRLRDMIYDGDQSTPGGQVLSLLDGVYKRARRVDFDPIPGLKIGDVCMVGPRRGSALTFARGSLRVGIGSLRLDVAGDVSRPDYFACVLRFSLSLATDNNLTLFVLQDA